MINPRSAINFFKTPAGAFILFCLILGGIFFACKRFMPGETKPQPLVYSTKAAAAAASKQTLQTFQNTNYSPMMKLPPATATGDMPSQPATAATGEPSQKEAVTADVPAQREAQRWYNHAPPKPEVLAISLFAETPLGEQKQLSKNYAPYGRLIFPAGTEVHGKAQTDRSRERIASGDNWTLVWTTGEELRLSGVALDREADPGGDGWGITDGSAGLRGQVLKSDDLAEIKLFAATFLSGAAAAFTQTQPTVLGSQIAPTLENAPLTGAQSVIQAYAQQILNTIQRDGFYVRVPAGKQFYLYVTQTIDESEAVIGGTRQTPNDFAAETNQPTASSRRNFSPDATAYRNGAMP